MTDRRPVPNRVRLAVMLACVLGATTCCAVGVL